MMLSAMRFNYELGVGLNNDVINCGGTLNWHEINTIQLILGLNLPSQLKIHKMAINDAIHAKLKGRLRIVNMQRIILVDYDDLIKCFDFINMS